MSDLITPEVLEAFAQAWHNTPEGEPGARRTAGLLAALEIIEPKIRAEGYDDGYWDRHKGRYEEAPGNHDHG